MGRRTSKPISTKALLGNGSGNVVAVAYDVLPRSAVLAAFVLGWVLQMIQAQVVGDGRWMAQHTAQFAAGAAVWLFATWPWARGFVRLTFIAAAVAIPVAWIANLYGALPGPTVPRGQRSGLWFGDPNPLGVMIAMNAAVASALLRRVRWLALPLWGLAAVVTAGMWTRGALVAVVLSFATWALTRYSLRGMVVVAGGTALMIAVFAASVTYGPERWSATFGLPTFERFVGASVVDREGMGGIFARLEAHEQAWGVIRATWPWGAGYGAFAEVSRDLPGRMFVATHAHHQVLQIAAETGGLGLLAWLAPLIAATWGLGWRGVWLLAPVIAVAGVLFFSEAPFLHVSAFYATWTALGLARQAADGSWHVKWWSIRSNEAPSSTAISGADDA